MAEYNFDQKEEGGTSSDTPETKKIPVESGHVTFHIGGTHTHVAATGDSSQPRENPITANPGRATAPAHMSKSHRVIKKLIGEKMTRGIPVRIWHGLEFVAVSAVIFLVLFFVINFDSYSRLFISKLDQLRGTVNNNPYIAQQLEKIRNASPEGQKPLPIVNTNQAAKKQIPDLSLDIAPPDDRILIPRIGQNVPIIRVPTDKLIQKDWAALEKQIQEALRYGVVHFPGTAMAGDDGNVVITGHSSYFPWDPGRFKDVFALLHQVGVGDKIVVYHEQKAYQYEVYEKKVVMPDEVEVLTQKGENRLTLITCTPVGTNLKRLVLLARPV